METKTIKVSHTGYSSKRYGPCEVCHNPCSDVVIGSVVQRYYDIEMLFGHETCVVESLYASINNGGSTK